MPIETTDAIVIKTVEFSETSLILTLFTRSLGKIHGIAKGARRLKNSFESALDLLAQINVSFIRKNGESLDLLTEAKLRSRFRPSATRLEGLNAGYYLAELLEMATADADPAPELYDLAAETLDRYSTGEGIAAARERFEWGLLDYLGEKPSLRTCVSCGKTIRLEAMAEKKERVAFGFLDGGAICPECRVQHGFQQVASVAAESLLRLDALDRLTTGAAEIERPLPEPNAKTRGELRGLLDYYFCSLLGRKPRTQDGAK